MAGTIAAGNAAELTAAGFKLGDRVCALVAGGGYAQYCVAPTGTCLNIPEVISLVEAAAMPETLFTVWVNLFERGFAADGDWVLVHGGTSGIGTMAIALGKLFGLKLIVTCGSDEKCGRAVELGARRRRHSSAWRHTSTDTDSTGSGIGGSGFVAFTHTSIAR